jgi:acyl carrier protein
MTSESAGHEAVRQQLVDRLRQLIVETCQVRDVRPAEIPEDVPIISGPGPLQLDSLDALEIAVALNREYGVEIEEVSAATQAFSSLGHLAEFLQARAAVGKARDLPLGLSGRPDRAPAP